MLHLLFQQCSGDWLCEPSGISQLDDGPVLIVNDTAPEKALFSVGTSALPEVRVSRALAKVTHGAAIGGVDYRQIETLVSRGVAAQEAVDIIVRGMLR